MSRLARSTAVLAALLLALGCGDGGRTNPVTTQQKQVGASESASITSQATLPINMLVGVPCALEDSGDTIALSGDLHVQSHWSSDGNGGVHVELHFNPQGVVGVGSNGDTYRGTGVTRSQFNVAADGFPFTSTFVNNFRIIGQGSGNNLMVHQVSHLTINANGDLTASVGSTEVDCR